MRQTQSREKLKECIEAATDCSNVCQSTIDYCLERGGKHAEARHVKSMMDCAEICRTCADFVSRGSEQMSSLCELCADICDTCAKSCSTMSSDERMQQCADACNRCAGACRDMTR